MRVELNHIDSIISALDSGRAAASLPISEFSLGAACEIAAWDTDKRRGNTLAWKQHGPFVAAVNLFEGRGSLSLANGAMHSLRTRRDYLEQPFQEFLMQFAAKLKQNGFGLDGLHQGIAGAFEAMTDNVVQHSSSDGETVRAVAGYAVTDGAFEFAVSDLGVGVLASLQQNPAHQAVTSARVALDLIARHGASRRAGEGVGNGYRDLFTGLARMNGTVRIRSDEGLFTMTGSLDSCQPVGQSLPHKKGFCVAVEGKLK